MTKKKVGVIFGGKSTEHKVSVVSGTSVIKNLNKQKYDIYPIFISEKGEWFKYTIPVDEIQVLTVDDHITQIEPIQNPINVLNNIDVVFPVLHGLNGEDGTIQGLLELLDKNYVGCKVLASSVCMDKAYTKIILDRAKINQAKYMYIRKYNDSEYIYIDEEFNEKTYKLEDLSDIVEKNLNFPVFVKPSNSGSSVGINKSYNKEELIEHITYASKYDKKILIEKNINGREVECAVLGNEDVKASCIGEILPAEDFYTFDAKYKNAESKVVIPATLSEEITEKIRKMAIKAFKAVDGKGLARVDFFVENETNNIILNEINTMPGFTQISMYPKLWEASGISYTNLLDELIELA